MSVAQWSKTPSLNATSDAGINLRDNQAPSVVKFNGRTMMADIAQWRDDLAGVIATTGTSTAYAVASNQQFTALTDGLVISCTMHATNGLVPTLAVDGLTAKPMRLRSGINPGAGTFVAGSPYIFVYRLAADEWIAFCVYDVAGELPIGAYTPYSGTASPSSNFVLPFGQALSRTTYATLFSRTGTVFGVGDGSTTFNVIDLRGRTTYGLDNMGGSGAGRITGAAFGSGTTLGAASGVENQALSIGQLPTVTPAGLITVSNGSNQFQVNSSAGFAGGSAGTGAASGFSQILNITATFAGTPFGSGQSHNNMPPGIMTNWLLRVL